RRFGPAGPPWGAAAGSAPPPGGGPPAPPPTLRWRASGWGPWVPRFLSGGAPLSLLCIIFFFFSAPRKAPAGPNNTGRLWVCFCVGRGASRPVRPLPVVGTARASTAASSRRTPKTASRFADAEVRRRPRVLLLFGLAVAAVLAVADHQRVQRRHHEQRRHQPREQAADDRPAQRRVRLAAARQPQRPRQQREERRQRPPHPPPPPQPHR